MLHPHLRPQLPALFALCQRLGVQQLHLFGSAVTDRFDPARSDVDAVVSFPPGLDPSTAANASSTCGMPWKNSSAGAWI